MAIFDDIGRAAANLFGKGPDQTPSTKPSLSDDECSFTQTWTLGSP